MRYLTIIAALAATSFAAPTPEALRGSTEWSPTLAGYFDLVYKHIKDARQRGGKPPTCDLSKASLPVAPTPLDFLPDYTLEHVAIGRGTQNYTCANATAAPAAAGAVARFYNISCMAADYPNLVPLASNLAYERPLPEDPLAPFGPTGLELSTHHFFSNGTTPVFAFDAPSSPNLGRVFAQKAGDSVAPANALQNENGVIPWLYLTSRSTTEGDIRAVYRVDTAGGSPPATCKDQPSSFTVDYAAVYWFFK
ncbi:hypothetical protein B0A52_09400 [Exophiala mesophila]|uniref:Malate dehydrogenase n=1 Tax=Exophiala mesophila TaxID=212818 RepID=A0A438MUV3_EXOME|nr:hypothetical protein B0A52_09400 [Exophiala mesophila]